MNKQNFWKAYSGYLIKKRTASASVLHSIVTHNNHL